MHCPAWIFDVAVSRVVLEFLSSELGLESFASKYADGLAERYELISEEVFVGASTEFLEFLSEVNAGDQAVKILTDYSYYRTYVEFDKGRPKPRKLKPLFGTAEDPVKQSEFDPKSTVKSFKAYVFALRSSTVETAPAGWSLEGEDENLPHFAELSRRSASILDSF